MIQARRRRLAAVTDTPLWGVGVVGLGCGMLTGRKAGPVCVVGTWRESGVNGNCLYFLLSFAVNLKLLYKIKLNFKKKIRESLPSGSNVTPERGAHEDSSSCRVCKKRSLIRRPKEMI